MHTRTHEDIFISSFFCARFGIWQTRYIRDKRVWTGPRMLRARAQAAKESDRARYISTMSFRWRQWWWRSSTMANFQIAQMSEKFFFSSFRRPEVRPRALCTFWRWKSARAAQWTEFQVRQPSTGDSKVARIPRPTSRDPPPIRRVQVSRAIFRSWWPCHLAFSCHGDKSRAAPSSMCRKSGKFSPPRPKETTIKRWSRKCERQGRIGGKFTENPSAQKRLRMKPKYVLR